MGLGKIAALLLLTFASAPALAQQPAPNPELLKFGVDSRTPLTARVVKAGGTTMHYSDGTSAVWTDHPLTDADRRKLEAALEKLSPLQTTVLRERLHSISFVDGMTNANAMTSRVLSGPAINSVFDIQISARVLDETVSQFLTRKDSQTFDDAGSTFRVSIEAGSMDALAFVLLHEATHAVDMTYHLTPQVGPSTPISDATQTDFARGVWQGVTLPAPAYTTDLLSTVRARKPIPISQAAAFYADLSRTPFPTIYAMRGVMEDVCELLALRELTGRLGQPYRIEVRDGDRVVYSYEPMKSPLVRSRLPALARFDSPDAPPPPT